MPRHVSSSSSTTTICHHKALTFDPSPHAAEVGYKFRTLQSRIKASTLPSTTIAKTKKKSPHIRQDPRPSSFLAPLVLPGDELAYDPKCPGQSVASWMKLDSRNPTTKDKGVIYVAAPPNVDDEVAFIEGWMHPTLTARGKRSSGKIPRSKTAKKNSIIDNANDDDSTRNLALNDAESPIQRPAMSDILDYLAAFYHGIPVKPLPTTLRFTSWEDSAPEYSPKKDKRSRNKTTGDTQKQYIALTTDTESVRISCRGCPDKTFPGQINLNDLLDAAESMLPSDAYALLLVVDQDLFEDDDDDFACGRAYGGSRISVVSTARYNPTLDGKLAMDRSHSWPASHCEEYVTDLCDSTEEDITPMTKRRRKDGGQIEASISVAVGSPMHLAIATHASLPPLPAVGDTSKYPSSACTALSELWLGRVCRTASHELGHCFGLEHCVYYACVMQGTASMLEDERQPLYLCPVDLRKILYVTGKDILEYYETLLKFCTKHPKAQIFASYGEWINGRIRELSGDSGNKISL
ncbi:hypothetical protein FQN49_005668 [Arthroderma sp. PD_2]|nr:hypothetical protein FQN49_005668 [Arthroderma sp. PD_2]